jgi:hypothetical protein
MPLVHGNHRDNVLQLVSELCGKALTSSASINHHGSTIGGEVTWHYESKALAKLLQLEGGYALAHSKSYQQPSG